LLNLRTLTGVVVVRASEDRAALVAVCDRLARTCEDCTVVIAATSAYPHLDALRAAVTHTIVRYDDDTPLFRSILSASPAGFFAFLPDLQDLPSPPWVDLPSGPATIAPWLSPRRLPTSGVFAPGEPMTAWLANRQAIERLAALPGLPTLATVLHAIERIPSIVCGSSKATSAPGPARVPQPRTARLSMDSTVLAVIPHKDCEQYLPRCLESIARQTRPPDSICVVDDGSQGDPAPVVGAFDGVTLLRSSHNVGPYRTFQSVVNRTAYDAYLLLDADDWCAADRLELLLLSAGVCGAEIVGSQELAYSADGDEVVYRLYPQDVNRALSAGPSYSLLHGSAIFSRRVIERVGGFAGLPFAGDFEFLARAALVGRIVNTDRLSYYRRLRPDSLTAHDRTGLQSAARRDVHARIAARWQENADAVRAGRTPNLRPLTPCEPVDLTHVAGPPLCARAAGRATATVPRRSFVFAEPHVARPPSASRLKSRPTAGADRLLDAYRSLVPPAEMAASFARTQSVGAYAMPETSCLEWLDEALERGLLVSETQLRTALRAGGCRGPRGRIATVNVVTNVTGERASRLLACVDSLARNLAHHDRAIPIAVFDDSRAPAATSAGPILRERAARSGLNVRYTGIEQKERYACALAAAASAPLDVVRFAMLGDRRLGCTVGANRNSVLLDNVGRQFLSVDDDVLAARAQRVSGHDEVVTTSLAMPEFWFDAPVRLGENGVVDVVGEHERVLGESAWMHLLAAQPELNCRDMSERLRRVLIDANGCVKASFNGSVGDGAIPNPASLWLLGGASRDRLLRTPDTYQQAIGSRALMRAYGRVTFTDGVGSCFGLAQAVDVTGFVPPFFPVLTGEDFLFAHLTQQFDRRAFFAHVPFVMEHKADAGRAYGRELAVAAGAETHTASLLTALASYLESALPPSEPADHCRRLGRQFQDLARLPADDFGACVDDIIRSAKRGYAERVYSVLQTHGAGPLCWSRDLARQLEVVEDIVRAPGLLLPTDIPLEPVDRTLQELVKAYGELLEWWPALLQAAGSLAETDIRVSD
jgi:hypothetical protein